MKLRSALLAIVAALELLSAVAHAGGSKLLATSGGQQLEGQAGGGIVPWALIAGYGDVGQWGASAAASRVRVDDFELDVAGLAFGLNNRVELSYARQRLEVRPLGAVLRQDILAGKVRLGGDLVYGRLPLFTAGLQWKKNLDGALPFALGAENDRGTDFTVAASRLWLDAVAGRNVFANLTLRRTAANELGLLGFGSTAGEDHSIVAEASAGVFLNRHWVVGTEYRQKPEHLQGITESDWRDLFVGWFPGKRLSIIGAYTDLGTVAGLPRQRGFYLSLQLTH